MKRITPFLLAALGLSLLLAGCTGGENGPEPLPPREPPPPAGPFLAGMAEAKLPVPVGIGTMGYGAIGQDIESVTPFADSYPGTTRQHGALTVRAVALSRGPAHELIFVRTDTVAIFQHLREAVLDELEARTGRNLDDALIIGANHTHSGPGRLLQYEGMLELLTDSFFPELYDRIVATLADVVEQALGDLAPAEVGWTMGANHEAHHDRRCENDALDQVQEMPDLPIVAVRRGGVLQALVMSYAYHGTVLSLDDLTLSGDLGGAAEQKIAERLDHPVMVLLFSSWGGDMAPGDEGLDPTASGAAQPPGYDKLQGLGVRLADTVVPLLDTIEYTGEPRLRGATYRVSINRQILGYPDDVFYFPYGVLFCSAEGNCEDAAPVPSMDKGCLAFSQSEPAPDRTVFTVGWVDDLSVVTGSGEWVTGLADEVVGNIRDLAGGEVMFIGYANDHTGYSTSEEDWWQGGYEAGAAIWGPRQGDYYAARLFEMYRHVHDLSFYLPFEQPPPLLPFSGYSYDPYVPEGAVGAGTITADVPATAAATDVVTFTVLGSDPWLGAPVATLLLETPSGFEPVLRGNGTEVSSDGYDLWVDLVVEPTYESVLPATERTFSWTFSYPVSRKAQSTIGALHGSYRFRVVIPIAGGSEVVAETSSFTVE